MLKQHLKSQPFLKHHEEIATICAPLFKLGISSYVYVRTYVDGSEIRLGNRHDWLEHYLTQELYKDSVLEKTPEYYQAGAVLWSTLKSHSKILDSAKNDFNIDHGVTLINSVEENTHAEITARRSYCEKTFFGAAQDNPGIVNLYLSNPDLLRNFNSYFKEKASKLIQQADRNRLHLLCNTELNSIQQQDLQMINRSKVSIKSVQQELQSPANSKSVLTRREQQVATYILQGNTAAEIADNLFLSRRTVEAHTDHIKEKLHARNKAELVIRLSQMMDV